MTESNNCLEGKVAWVTGGASGIGESTVRTLAEKGASVGILDIDTDKAASLIEELGLVAVNCDIADQTELHKALDTLNDKLGEPYILVNSAGVSYGQRVAKHDVDGWQRVMDINLTGPFLTARYVLGGMIQREEGRIINVSSGAAVRVVTGSAAYGASKAGLQALTKAIAHEGAKAGVTCNAVAPGTIDTPLARSYFAKPEDLEEAVKTPAFSNPMHALMKPFEIARVITFLCEPDSAHITGQTLYINAGGVMP